ncbi:LacI family DNA-binding transcriptional regulator [Leucobacter weissii]|uniref:LacI family DNA-binding transcriptional regulator n=1 Tax=Leucobacter weissii TaxID=1983706 RepID=A0A939MHW6_9MICO|nr:LacI family DNA-binding transcriptional regulator [Leucobacter weissii]
MAIRRGITIHDVARRAGVSTTTVSHALNEKGTISERTRERVKSVAADLGYQADALARGLRSSRMGVIGLVLRPLDALGSYAPSGVDYFLRFAGAAAGRALDLGLGLMQVGDLTKRPITPLAFSLDGYIVMDPMDDDPVIGLLQKYEMPFVTLGRDVRRPEANNWVASDDRRSVRTSLSHLHERGARSIAFVAGVDGNSWNRDGEEVYLGWCAEHGVAPRLLHIPESDGEAGGRRAARQLLEEGLPDGVHCMTGRHAAGLQAELREHGVTTPEHLLLVAGSDAEPSRAGTPPITGFDLNPERLAQATVNLLDATIRGEAPPARTLLGSRFIVRASTGGERGA